MKLPDFLTDTERRGGRGQMILAGVFGLVALATTYMPEGAQTRAAGAIQATVLRPFIGTQARVADSRLRQGDFESMRESLDSLVAATSTWRALDDENRTLRGLLELKDRVGPRYAPAPLLRSGTPGSESMFILPLGYRDGVQEGAPVVDRYGLLGVVREVRPSTSIGIEWTHPDFRASAMIEDGSAYGIVESRRGDFPEDARLVLTGGAYHEEIPDSSVVITSGLGRMLPRGIVIGVIDGVAEVQAEWRKNYWVRPTASPWEATHVMVAVGTDTLPPLGAASDTTDSTLAAPFDTLNDLGEVWPPDSALSRVERMAAERRAFRRVPVLEDSLLILKIRLGMLSDSMVLAADSTIPEVRAVQRQILQRRAAAARPPRARAPTATTTTPPDTTTTPPPDTTTPPPPDTTTTPPPPPDTLDLRRPAPPSPPFRPGAVRR